MCEMVMCINAHHNSQLALIALKLMVCKYLVLLHMHHLALQPTTDLCRFNDYSPTAGTD